MTHILRLLQITLLVTLTFPVYAADAVAGKAKSQVCAACHGVDGNSPTNPTWPKLAGQHEKYTYKQLKDFHSGERKDIQMTGFAATLRDEDMSDIAAYYATQKIQLGFASSSLLDLGQKIYRAGNASKELAACIACHGPNGAGNPLALYPSLSGQHAEYTEIQLLNFRDNKRTNDINRVMRIISEKMTIEEIKAVSNYIQGLH